MWCDVRSKVFRAVLASTLKSSVHASLYSFMSGVGAQYMSLGMLVFKISLASVLPLKPKNITETSETRLRKPAKWNTMFIALNLFCIREPSKDSSISVEQVNYF